MAQQANAGWALKIPYAARLSEGQKLWQLDRHTTAGEQLVSGDAATAALRQLLPLVNRSGASPGVVGTSVSLMTEWGGSESVLTSAASRLHDYAARQTFGDTGALVALPLEVRLAMEMAVHEDIERRAMEGELHVLEQAWRDAEEVAAIADDLLMPTGITGALARLRARGST